MRSVSTALYLQLAIPKFARQFTGDFARFAEKLFIIVANGFSMKITNCFYKQRQR